MNRHKMHPSHPVFDGYRKLNDDDILEPGDEVASVSSLLLPDSPRLGPAYGLWASVMPDWEDDVGKTIEEICSKESADADAWDRVFRRPIPRKVIMINDSNGHGHTFSYTTGNMKYLLQMVLDANEHSTMMEDPDQGRQLLKKPDVTAEEIESYMRDWNGPVDRAAGGMIHFVELKPVMEFPYNPFT